MVQKYKTSDIDLFGKISLSENVNPFVKKTLTKKKNQKNLDLPIKIKIQISLTFLKVIWLIMILKKRRLYFFLKKILIIILHLKKCTLII